MFGENKSAPVTLTSITATVVKKVIMDYLNCENAKDFDLKYRGLVKEYKRDEDVNDRKLNGHTFSAYYVPINYETKLVLDIAKDSYHGGYNSSSEIGYFPFITKDKDNKFEIQKSTEFNGGMGIENLGGAIYDMLKDFKEPLLFDAMIRDFDERYFKYGYEVMTYFPDEQHNPYIDKEGNEYFEYSQTENQFKFFKDDNGEYIYTSDSNYIKNMSDEDITVVCSNGNYVLKPNQILITDYNECVNNTRMTFGEKIDEKIEVDELSTKEYIPTRKQEIILDNIIKTIEYFNYSVSPIYENGMISGMEIETWTNGGVDMIHTFYFCDDYQELYDKENVKKQLQELVDNFSVDDEIDMYRQDANYKSNFTISQSLEDFTEYQKKLEDLANNFNTKYHELIYQKFMNNELQKEEMQL